MASFCASGALTAMRLSRGVLSVTVTQQALTGKANAFRYAATGLVATITPGGDKIFRGRFER